MRLSTPLFSGSATPFCGPSLKGILFYNDKCKHDKKPQRRNVSYSRESPSLNAWPPRARHPPGHAVSRLSPAQQLPPLVKEEPAPSASKKPSNLIPTSSYRTHNPQSCCPPSRMQLTPAEQLARGAFPAAPGISGSVFSEGHSCHPAQDHKSHSSEPVCAAACRHRVLNSTLTRSAGVEGAVNYILICLYIFLRYVLCGHLMFIISICMSRSYRKPTSLCSFAPATRRKLG